MVAFLGLVGDGVVAVSACGDLVLVAAVGEVQDFGTKNKSDLFPPSHSSLTLNWAIGSDKLTRYNWIYEMPKTFISIFVSVILW